LTRHAAVERDALVERHQPLIREAMPYVAHPQIRNRGTLGGNLSHADPASEMPAIVLALGGTLHLRSATAERQVAAKDFFVGALETAIQPDEMLVEIALPHYIAALVEACMRAGQIEDGLLAVSEGLAVGEKNKERFYEAEVYRIKGELSLQRAERGRQEAEGR